MILPTAWNLVSVCVHLHGIDTGVRATNARYTRDYMLCRLSNSVYTLHFIIWCILESHHLWSHRRFLVNTVKCTWVYLHLLVFDQCCTSILNQIKYTFTLACEILFGVINDPIAMNELRIILVDLGIKSYGVLSVSSVRALSHGACNVMLWDNYVTGNDFIIFT